MANARPTRLSAEGRSFSSEDAVERGCGLLSKRNTRRTNSNVSIPHPRPQKSKIINSESKQFPSRSLVQWPDQLAETEVS